MPLPLVDGADERGGATGALAGEAAPLVESVAMQAAGPSGVVMGAAGADAIIPAGQ